MYPISVFGVGSALILALSWKSLRDPHVHGFYRFFAFECLLGLLALNVTTRWFADPFSARQTASWVLLFGSLALALHGFYLLRRRGRPKRVIEGTARLVTSGAYRFIRHPLYASLVYLGWGVFLKRPSVVAAGLAIGQSAFLFATAKVEENENLRAFGDRYRAYVRATKMFLPYVL